NRQLGDHQRGIARPRRLIDEDLAAPRVHDHSMVVRPGGSDPSFPPDPTMMPAVMPDGSRDIYGTRFECSCGRTHDIQPEAVVYADDAIARMPAACAELGAGRTCVVIDDVRTRAVAGDEVARAMTQAGWLVRRLLLDDPAPGQDPVCDDHTHARLLPQVEGAALVLPVGSGVI